MAENSKIEWCDHTVNFWWGCFKVSPGCQHCYAETLSNRYGKSIWGPAKTSDRERKKAVWTNVLRWDKQAREEGVRKRLFVMSMGDFLEDHPQVSEWRNEAAELLEGLTNTDVQLLTKRPENAIPFLPHWFDNWPSHIWIGTSVENQETADKRIPELLKIPARVRFLSCEPLLGAIDLSKWTGNNFVCRRCGFCASDYQTIPLDRIPIPNCGKCDHSLPSQRVEILGRGLHWVIVGGESGPKARPMHPDWARSIRDQCLAADVPFFFKQWGEYVGGLGARDGWVSLQNGTYPAGDKNTHEWGMGIVSQRVGKKVAGRLLDGVEWSQFPATDCLSRRDV